MIWFNGVKSFFFFFAFLTELSSSYCNITWDTVTCWPETLSNQTAVLPCPQGILGTDPTSKFTIFLTIWNQNKNLYLLKYLLHFIISEIRESHRSVVANVLNCSIVVSEFRHKSCYYTFAFRLIPLGKVRNLLSPAMDSIVILLFFLQEWILH